MSIFPTSGVAVSAAGSGLAQVSGHHGVRAQQAATEQQARIESQRRAEDTAGIAATDGEDQEAHDRDADGRRPWEFPRHQPGDAPAEEPVSDPTAKLDDSSGSSGSQLDLTG